MFNKLTSEKIVPLILFVLLIFCRIPWAEESVNSVVAKENNIPGSTAFTNPGKTMDMGAEWESRPISHEDQAEKADIAIVLDQHLYPALLPLIEEYAGKNNLEIAVLDGTCGISAGKLREKKADMAGFCCPPGETDRLPGLAFHTIGIASLALFVNETNPLTDIDLKTTQNIFRGHITHWKELGKDIPIATGKEMIQPIGRLHCKARPGHWRLILDNEDMFSPRLHEVSTIPDMISNVEKKRGAIGYETLWMVEKYEDPIKVKVLRINGYSPFDNEALVAGDYPFYRTFSITTWTDEPAKKSSARELAVYIISNAHRIDSKYGIIPVQKLRQAGWKFTGNELTGEPD